MKNQKNMNILRKMKKSFLACLLVLFGYQNSMHSVEIELKPAETSEAILAATYVLAGYLFAGVVGYGYEKMTQKIRGFNRCR